MPRKVQRDSLKFAFYDRRRAGHAMQLLAAGDAMAVRVRKNAKQPINTCRVNDTNTLASPASTIGAV
jgi:hypothetical protein